MSGSRLFEGELALVTGSASNIGRAIAEAIAREGARVVLVDLNAAGNAATAQAIAKASGDCEPVSVDLATREGWKIALDALGSRVPHMFVHAACPRRHESDTPLDVDEATFDAMLAVNVRSGFLLGREIGRRMKLAALPGRMLYVTSLHAESPRNLAHYSAGKAGMTMVMKELARDLGPAQIRVNAIAPGAIPGGGAASMTPAMGARIALRRTGTADDIARMALALLSDRFAGYVTGTTVAVDGGLALYNWIPFAGSEPGQV